MFEVTPLARCTAGAASRAGSGRGRAIRPAGAGFPTFVVGLLLLPLLLLFLLLLLFPTGLRGQEVRAGLGVAFPNVQTLPTATGYGFGARWITGRGVGLGLEFDRYEGDTRFGPGICGGAEGPFGGPCILTSTMDVVALNLIFEVVDSPDWRIRLSLGRSAGRIVGVARDVDSGEEARPVGADRGKSHLAWSRGNDGSVIAIEVLRVLPGPVPAYLLAALRNHVSEMDGCVVGEFAPYCGRLAVPELQVGLLFRWPGRWWGGED